MRTAFIEELTQAAAEDERIWLICGDLGYSVLERFSNAFPNRYLNAGVAEQNMTGVAAGLALSGKIVFTYSIANFPIMRCLEQVRNDICYHNLDVKIVSVGGGLAYGTHGYTHHAVEDLAVMRALPGMNVVAPGDPIETRSAVRALIRASGPAYLRLGKAGEPVLHTGADDFPFGKAIRMRTGSQVTLLTTGAVLGLAIEAAETLAHQGISVALMSVPYLEPFDREAILEAAANTGLLVTIEEHGPGGLASAVAEVLAIAGIPARLIPIRLRHEILKAAGGQQWMRAALGVSAKSIVDSVVEGIGSRLV